MKLMIVINEVEKGGYWMEVPSITGYITQRENLMSC